MLNTAQLLNSEKKLLLLYKKSLSVPKLSNEYKILKETSELLLLSFENTLKELQKKENLNVHNVIKQSNTEIINIILNKVYQYKIKD